jgi:hypothetical protein
MDLADYPAVLFVVSLGILFVAVEIGIRFAPRIHSVRDDFDVILGATLTLLGLLVGFTFSMAVGRYDLRKRCEAEEANAIGTEYMRAGLLPNAANVRSLLHEYLDQRILSYRTRDAHALENISASTNRLQNNLWDAVKTSALPTQTALVTLAVSGMNDVLNTRGYTEAAWLNRIPAEAWALLAFIATCANFMVGLSVRHRNSMGLLAAVIPVIVSISLLLISDVDSPRGGLIHVRSPNLVNLGASLQP